MAVNIENIVSVDAPREFFTLEEIREFVENTKEWASETKVKPTVNLGQRDPFVKLTSKYGDTTGNY